MTDRIRIREALVYWKALNSTLSIDVPREISTASGALGLYLALYGDAMDAKAAKPASSDDARTEREEER